MTNKNVLNLIDYSEGGILSKILFKTNKTQVTLFSMAAGTDISEHTSSKEGYVYVLEGKGIFNLEGKEIPMESGRIINMEKDAKHSLNAEKDTSFLLILTS
ncbi:MAG: cupin [Nanoarchaeota archaeon]|jgi:quercetin dioxygenase-like cupin family protein|nr:cupin [Nanoarchaeota archaeon]|tara:strand:- start:26909 stop:27211 length:303 start_codon:yes stop_codon:yes gene_type:complete